LIDSDCRVSTTDSDDVDRGLLAGGGRSTWRRTSTATASQKTSIYVVTVRRRQSLSINLWAPPSYGCTGCVVVHKYVYVTKAY